MRDQRNGTDAIRQRANVSAARTLGLRLLVFNVRTDSELAAAFATLVERQAGAVLVGGGVQLRLRNDQIISLAVRYALPTMFAYGFAVREGGLSSYGSVLSEAFAKPASIPAVFSRAKSPPTCRCSWRRGSNLSST